MKNIGIIVNKNIKNNEFITDKLHNSFYKCPASIVNFIVKHDAFPVLMTFDKDFSSEYLEMIDGLLLIGDKDIPSFFYGNNIIQEESELMNENKMRFQMIMLNKILVRKEKNIPILCICAGMQSLNVAFKGTLYSDIQKDIGSIVVHNPSMDKYFQNSHKVKIKKNTLLYDILKTEEIATTSSHHQAIKNLGENLYVSAICSDDSIIEAIEYKGHNFCLGVQWHVEREADENDTKIFKYFLDACG